MNHAYRSLQTALAGVSRLPLWLIPAGFFLGVFLHPYPGITSDIGLNLDNAHRMLVNVVMGGHLPYTPVLYSLNALASAAAYLSYRLFFASWHVLGPDRAIFLPMTVLMAVTVYAIGSFIRNATGDRRLALVTQLVFACYPWTITLAQTNVRDTPVPLLTILFFSGLLAYLKSPTLRRGLWLAAVTGLGLAVKINFIFMPVIAALYLAIRSWRNGAKVRLHPAHLALMAVCAVLVFYLAFPQYLRPFDPLGLMHYVSRYASDTTLRQITVYYFGHAYVSGDLPRSYIAVNFLIKTPLPFLLGLLAFAVPAVRRACRLPGEVRLLCWLTLLVVCGRGFLYPFPVYNDIRLVIEITVPTAILAADGLLAVFDLARAAWRTWLGAAFAVYLLSLLVAYQGAYGMYVSELFGGPALGSHLGIPLDDYQYEGKAAAIWLLRNAPDGSTMYTGYLGPIMDFYLAQPGGFYLWFGTSSKGFPLRGVGEADYVAYANGDGYLLDKTFYDRLPSLGYRLAHEEAFLGTWSYRIWEKE